MKNIMKTLFVSIASLSLMFSVNAGEMTVNGTAKATYNMITGDQRDNGIGITNELNFTASGEMDNGFTWTYSMELDPDATDGSALNDDSQMSITMNEMGTVKICVSECSNSKKYFFDQSAYTTITDTSLSTGGTYPANEMSYASLQYSTPELPFGTKLQASYGQGKTESQSGNAAGPTGSQNSMEGYSITMNPVDGLNLAANYYDVNDYSDGDTTENQLEEGGAWGVTYSLENVSIGYGKSYKAPESTAITAGATTAEYYENTGYSVGYAINEDVSVSYSREEMEQNMQTSDTVTYDIEVDSVQIAYSLGGATLSVARSDYENKGYVQNEDATETLIALTFAF